MKQANTVRVSARKKPSQSRSQQKVARILESTRELLIDSPGSSSANLTTQRIAKKAGIAVGTLYQYFPNVEAVLYEIYRGFAERAREVIADFDSATHLTMPREQFFDNLVRALTASTAEEHDIIRAIRAETWAYSSLAEMEKDQAEFFAREMAKFLMYYGSHWSAEKLERVGLFVYYLDWGAWMYRDHAKSAPDEAKEWEVMIFKTAIAQCFE